MATLADNVTVLLLGASGACGQALLQRLHGQGVNVIAVSRNPPERTWPHVLWLEQDLDLAAVSMEASVLVSTGPLIHAIRQVEVSSRLGRVVALSSASTQFKANSPDPREKSLMRGLIEQEHSLQALCARRDVTLTLIKPTLIYGGSNNLNVNRVGGLSDRLPVLPYCGKGLRHPVHADDLAQLMLHCLAMGDRSAGSWLVGGGEVLDYASMLGRIAIARGRMPRLLRLPLWTLRLALGLAHATGRLLDVTPVMLERQRVDLLVDDAPAREMLGWNPRAFRP
jgi:nucleoside-diphosphate-sugar epimerase